MTPAEYELCVAEHFRLRGYAVRCTAASNDYGVDVFAEKGSEKLAIQAKMYKASCRLVNRDVVLHLYGAKAFFDCTAAVIVTDGTLMDDAAVVAKKLGVDVIKLQPDELSKPPAGELVPPADKIAFDTIWTNYVMPLEGVVITNSRGGNNAIIRVDWCGVE